MRLSAPLVIYETYVIHICRQARVSVLSIEGDIYICTHTLTHDICISYTLQLDQKY